MTTPLPPSDPSRPDEPLPNEAELAALYRELPQNEPSPALDAAILRAAADALTGTAAPHITERRHAPRERGDWVHPKTPSDITAAAIPSVEATVRRRRAPHWVLTLASAASLVLVAGLAWHLRETSPPPSTPSTQGESTGATSAVAAKASPQVSSTDAALESSAAPGGADSSPSQLADRQAAMQASAAKQVKQDSALQSAKRQAAATPLATPPPVAETTAPAPAPPAPPAPPAAPDISANAISGQLDKASRSTAPASAAQSAATGVKDTSPQAGDTPAQELAKIQQLLDEGQRDAALPRLRAFRQAHPQWPLSQALQAQLQEP